MLEPLIVLKLDNLVVGQILCNTKLIILDLVELILWYRSKFVDRFDMQPSFDFPNQMPH